MKPQEVKELDELWNRIDSEDFKTFVLNSYGNINYEQLVQLIELNRKVYNLKVQIKSKEETRIYLINNLILQVAKKHNLETLNKPSFSKILSIKIGDDYISVSQKQINANNGRGIMGGSSYEFRNSYNIWHNNSGAYSQVKYNDLYRILDNYIEHIIYENNLKIKNETKIRNI